MLSERGFSQSRCVPAGSTLFVCIGSTIGKVGLAGVDLTTNQQINSIVPNDGVDPEFLFYATSTLSTLVREQAGEQAVPLVNKSQFSEFEIPLPPLAEQRTIATALRDADDLIATLEHLIAKKQAIKQGMMQQLLTGRTRLPGFRDDWLDLRIGDLGRFKGGSGFAPRYQGTATGPIPFFKVSDMNHKGNELFMRRANNYITASQRKSMAAVLMPAEAIVFAKVGAAVFLERKRILTAPSCVDNNMAAYIVDKARVDVRFMHYFLSDFPMSSLVATGALPSLNGGQLRSIPISLPTDLDEQRAIAAVLVDADAEVGVLQARLNKARDAKTGMMQQLLTGRTRLPVEAMS